MCLNETGIFPLLEVIKLRSSMNATSSTLQEGVLFASSSVWPFIYLNCQTGHTFLTQVHLLQIRHFKRQDTSSRFELSLCTTPELTCNSNEKIHKLILQFCTMSLLQMQDLPSR